jgi:8-oxo-dGTP pyrophosphatase MutT (NUDIX family)
MRLERVLQELGGSLPPVDDSSATSIDPDETGLRRAAVLVLLFPDDDRAAFLLTRRPESLRSHPGQISLPGGRVEPIDASPWDTALRETWEEIGIAPSDVHPVGRLAPVEVTVSNNLILPYVGRLSRRPVPGPPTDEVDELIEAPVSLLLDRSSIEEQSWVLRDHRHYLVTYYRVGPHAVWGVTARILSDLAGHLGAETGPYPPGSVRPDPNHGE